MQIENEKSRSKYDLTGHEFGLLTVVGMAPRERDEKGHLLPVKWICKCECGKITEKITGSLLSGSCRSCGCLLAKNFKNFKGRPPKDKTGLCPYPCNRCPKSMAGACCAECEKRDSCHYVCQNSPERCGRDK
ncbi:MAG: hypothetical protein IKK97_01570 [Phascolarctobacterium sp.]|nr:hypothetical protein [Phascolarctobacterium sp.]